MGDVYSVMNRLKCRGMRGWSPTTKEWLGKRLTGINIDRFIICLSCFLEADVYKLRIEEVVEYCIKYMDDDMSKLITELRHRGVEMRSR